MLSPRSRFEFACRVGAFAALGWLLGASLIPPVRAGTERATDAELAERLPAWTRAPAAVSLHGDFAAAPSGWETDWLAALRRSGRAVSWSGAPLAVAISAEPFPDPAGGVRIDVAAPRGSTVYLRDDVGVIDSVLVRGAGGSAFAPIVLGPLRALVGNQPFGAAAPESSQLRPIIVIGAAGWEGKFIVEALEESGWRVLTRFSVAPNVAVTSGNGAALVFDTSRVAAVIALDSTIQAYGADLERFVHSGGGLVLAGAASRAPSVASVAPGTLGARVRPAVERGDTTALGSTGFYPLSLVRADAVVLDRRGSGVAIAALRLGAGRVLQVGYDDSWRWRMAGGPGAERAHREWWSRVAGAVAYVPAGVSGPASAETAPLARLIDRLGPPRAAFGGRAHGALIDTRILMAVMMACLIAEWSSRRLRGLK